MPKQKLLTDSRLPGKKYKTQRGLNQALEALKKSLRGSEKYFEVFPEDRPTTTLALSEAAEAYLAEEASGAQGQFYESPAPVKDPYRPPETPARFVRNNYHTEVALRLDRHEGKRRIELKPRGQRGDLAPLQPGDLSDPILVQNVNIGLVEIINAGEAAEIAGKQTINQQKVHPALASLRNALGEEYEQDAIITEIPFEQQGVVVAELEDGNVVVGPGGIQRRKPGQEPGTPDYVVGAERHHAPAGEEAAFLSDLRARSKAFEGPEAGLGGIRRVTVSDTESVS